MLKFYSSHLLLRKLQGGSNLCFMFYDLCFIFFYVLFTMKNHLLIYILNSSAEAIDKVDEESEMLHGQLLDNQIDISSFVQRYKKLRVIHHRRALIHLAAKTNTL